MKFILSVVLALACASLATANILDKFTHELKETCLKNSQCKPNQYCDHEHTRNPIGKCHVKLNLTQTCTHNDQCFSAICHLTKCVRRIPVKDGECQPNEHVECIATQFCAKRSPKHNCIDRLCSGWCTKHAQCLSNKCFIFWCKKPEAKC